MKSKLLPILLGLLPVVTMAQVTDLATAPLLNISGTGSVHPNLFLIFDDSGSMGWNYSPDYVNDAKNYCKSESGGGWSVACGAGDPPYMSPDFNKQYYSPEILYSPPVDYQGNPMTPQTAGNTSNWTSVRTDGYGKQNTDMRGNSATNSNLVTGFPDKQWYCSSAWKLNTNNYLYPDSTCTSSQYSTGAPYYYRIQTSEYCTNSSLSDCVSVAAGSGAPDSTYIIPAKVRWCKSSSDASAVLPGANCQSKKLDSTSPSYNYVRYSRPVQGSVSAGTIAIGATSYAPTGLQIQNIKVGTTTIADNFTISSSGTNTVAKQRCVATQLASKINTKQTTFDACVDNPDTTCGTGVPVCAPLNGQENVVRVYRADGSNTSAGQALTATSTTGVSMKSTGFLNITGPSTTGKNTILKDVTVGGTDYFGSNKTFSSNTSAADIASFIVSRIGTGGSTIKAYLGGNSVTADCAGKTSTTICLVHQTAANGLAVNAVRDTGGSYGSFPFTVQSTAGGVTEGIPLTTTAFTAGSTPPDPFQRVDLINDGRTFPLYTARTDCVASPGVCTYSEEMTNFANWYAYYRTRMQTAKTAVGKAFQPLTSQYRVGMAKLSNIGYSGSVDKLPTEFITSSRQDFYSKVYNLSPGSSTPLRTALYNAGVMFSSTTNGVVQYPCQQNFTILTTDGYWNDSSAPSAVTDNDRTASSTANQPRFCTQAGGCLDGIGGTVSLADVALHWYNGGSNTGRTSLRPDLESSSTVGLVPITDTDPNDRLHMTTFTLGLGLSGVVEYESSYNMTPITGGDFYKIITSATGCPWNSSGAYVWPKPASNAETTVDDLWHAAINGHGKYYSASNPQAVVDGLSDAIQSMQQRQGAAAAAATSTPNLSSEDSSIFSATFTTVKWYGELIKQAIDPNTGIVSATVDWSTTDKLGSQVGASPTVPRTVLMGKVGSATGELIEFGDFSSDATAAAWFTNKCASLNQCLTATAAQKAVINSATNLVAWLKGDTTFADDTHFRAYTVSTGTTPVPILLGDIASAKPAYTNYSKKRAFSGIGTRSEKMIYVAANDGMLHAFDADTGFEKWSYVPRSIMSKMYKLADKNYGTNHQFLVDGTPVIADADIGGWKRVLVAGLNGGGRGYYALDITNPTAPKLLWEFCADPAICSGAGMSDPNIGYTYGNPQIVQLGSTWVALLTSGYNNVPGTDGISLGDGKGYLYVVNLQTGQLISTHATGVGSTGTPSGFARIAAATANPQNDPKVTEVYGGDNLGNLWRFSTRASTTDAAGSSFGAALKLAETGSSKPITARPLVSSCDIDGHGTIRPVVLFGTGRLLGTTDMTNTAQQSVYMVKDSTTALGDPASNNTVQQTLSTSGNTVTMTANTVDLASKNGWYFNLTENAGERVNLDPDVVFGAAQIVTNIPTSSNACNYGGISWHYQVDLCKGTAVSDNASTNVVGEMVSNVAGAVGFIVVRLASGQYRMIVTTSEGTKHTREVSTGQSSAPRKTGWRTITE